MSALYLIGAFVLGALFWNRAGGFILKHVLRREGKMLVDAISGLPQKSLLKVYEIANDEIERRKKGLAA